MPNYFKVFIDGYGGYASYLWYEMTHPGLKNYFYWLILVSLFFLVLEWTKPCAYFADTMPRVSEQTVPLSMELI